MAKISYLYTFLINKERLMGVEMKFIPLLSIKSILVAGSGSASIQMEMKSAIVTDIKARNMISPQLATIQSMYANDPDVSTKVTQQLAKLEMSRQSSLLPPPSADDAPITSDEANSTLDGIKPVSHVHLSNTVQEAVMSAPRRFNLPLTVQL